MSEHNQPSYLNQLADEVGIARNEAARIDLDSNPDPSEKAAIGVELDILRNSAFMLATRLQAEYGNTSAVDEAYDIGRRADDILYLIFDAPTPDDKQ